MDGAGGAGCLPHRDCVESGAGGDRGHRGAEEFDAACRDVLDARHAILEIVEIEIEVLVVEAFDHRVVDHLVEAVDAAVERVAFEGDLDLAGEDRLNGASVDMGCYELASLPCPGDFDGNGIVDGADLATLLGQWGEAGSADLNEDGLVDGVAGRWRPVGGRVAMARCRDRCSSVLHAHKRSSHGGEAGWSIIHHATKPARMEAIAIAM